MDINTATLAFSALSQPLRLEVFRLLIKAGADGMQAGDIATTLGAKQNTMSANLSVLHRAGLIRNQREGRVIRYFADFDGTRGLLQFLMQDCCGGNPKACQPILAEIACHV
ncbi:MAG: metalloregulator ArsR/SmtB family transcription factor [Pseudomonadota bacterium]